MNSTLIHMPREPRMSDHARRIVRCASHLRMFMAAPEHSAWFDAHVYEVETALRRYAVEYIADACQDLDYLAWLSREAAAGRRFQQRLPAGGFCQAGVVAPPDSLMCEKNASMGQG